MNMLIPNEEKVWKGTRKSYLVTWNIPRPQAERKNEMNKKKTSGKSNASSGASKEMSSTQ